MGGKTFVGPGVGFGFGAGCGFGIGYGFGGAHLPGIAMLDRPKKYILMSWLSLVLIFRALYDVMYHIIPVY